jgi:hypothetical protein
MLPELGVAAEVLPTTVAETATAATTQLKSRMRTVIPPCSRDGGTLTVKKLNRRSATAANAGGPIAAAIGGRLAEKREPDEPRHGCRAHCRTVPEQEGHAADNRCWGGQECWQRRVTPRGDAAKREREDSRQMTLLTVASRG